MSIEIKVSQLETKVDSVSTQVSGIHNKMNKMEKQMAEMYTALVGNTALGHEGIVGRVESLEDTKEKWKGKMDWMLGYIVGAGTLISLLIEFVKEKMKS